MTKQELIDLVGKNTYYSVYEVEENLHLESLNKTFLNVNKHRYYCLGEYYYQCDDGIVGIYGPVALYNECASWEDIDIPCIAFEGEEIIIKSYKRK